MKTNRKVIIYLLLLLVFIIYQVSANYIFYVLIKTDQESGSVNYSLPPESQAVKFNVDEVKKENLKWKEGLWLRGWVFKLPQPISKKEVFLVLKSTKNTHVFKVKNSNIPRPGVLDFFKLEPGKFNKGFEMVIPRYQLDEDAYQIGFVIEDETGKYYTNSRLELKNISGDYTVVDLNAASEKAEPEPDPSSLSRQVPLSIQKPTKEVKFNFDNVNKTGRILKLRGWGFLDGLDAKSLKSHILLKGNKKVLVFDAKVEFRKDLTKYFSKTGLTLDSAGFQSVIPIGSMEKGRYQLGLYLLQGNQRGVVYTDKFIEIGK